MNKITCNVIKDILPLYIDGVVSEDTQKIVDEHLAECSLCRDEMNKLKKTLVIPTNEEIQQETVNVLEKSISSIERTVVKKFIHYSSYFDLIFNCDIIHIVLTMKKKQLNIMDSVVVMSIMVKLFLILILMAFLTAGILM